MTSIYPEFSHLGVVEAGSSHRQYIFCSILECSFLIRAVHVSASLALSLIPLPYHYHQLFGSNHSCLALCLNFNIFYTLKNMKHWIFLTIPKTKKGGAAQNQAWKVGRGLSAPRSPFVQSVALQLNRILSLTQSYNQIHFPRVSAKAGRDRQYQEFWKEWRELLSFNVTMFHLIYHHKIFCIQKEETPSFCPEWAITIHIFTEMTSSENIQHKFHGCAPDLNW